VLDATKAVGEKVVPPKAQPSAPAPANAVERFLELSPVTGDLLSIACVLAFKSKKPLVMADFTKAIDEKIDVYLSGFLAAMHAAQMIDRDVVSGSTRTYTINSVHPALETRGRPYLLEYLERAYKSKPALRDKWLEKLQRVEAIFSDGEEA
jgi:hypothetical protein